MAIRRLMVRESLYGGQSDESDDYAEAQWKMDKFMPDDENLVYEFQSILDNEDIMREGKIKAIIEILKNGDESIMQYYFPHNGTIKGFAEYIVDKEGYFGNDNKKTI